MVSLCHNIVAREEGSISRPPRLVIICGSREIKNPSELLVHNHVMLGS